MAKQIDLGSVKVEKSGECYVASFTLMTGTSKYHIWLNKYGRREGWIYQNSTNDNVKRRVSTREIDPDSEVWLPVTRALVTHIRTAGLVANANKRERDARRAQMAAHTKAAHLRVQKGLEAIQRILTEAGHTGDSNPARLSPATLDALSPFINAPREV